MARKPKQAPTYTDEVVELMFAAEEIEAGPLRVELFERAVRIADTHNDLDLTFQMRMELVEAATFGGMPEVSLVAFAWCLAKSDEDPERFDEEDLLWKYKWVFDQVVYFPQVPMLKINEMLSDFEKRCRKAGAGMHPTHTVTRSVRLSMGDLKAARIAHSKLNKSRKSGLSDCPACVADGEVDFYAITGQPQKAIRSSEVIFSGELTCAEVPTRTYAHVLLPLFSEGEIELAANYHRKGFRLVTRNPKLIEYAAKHIVFLTLTDNLSAATKGLEKQFANALQTTCLSWRFELYRAAILLCDRYVDLGKPFRIRWPDAFDGIAKAERGEASIVRDWFRSEAEAIAAKFDRRNENNWYAEQLDSLPKLKAGLTPYPISGSR